MVCWYLWKSRNEVVWNKKFTKVYIIIARAKQYLEQWRNAQRHVSVSNFTLLVDGDGSSTWVRPPEFEIKISVDAAMFCESNASEIGLVVRGSNGEVLQAKTVLFNELLDPDMAELLAMKEALSWSKDWPWQKIIIESDCLGVVQSIRSSVPMTSPFGLRVMEYRRMLQDQKTVSLLFIKWSANMVAHALARVSYSIVISI